MKTIAVTIYKGGSGKTTTAINLAHLLSKHGTVLCVEMDKTNFGLSKFAPGLSDAPIEFRVTTPGRLARLVASAKWDYCVIDCPPMLEKPALAALRVADLAVVPAVPEIMVMDGLATMVEVLDNVRNPRLEGANPKLDAIVLPSMCDRRDSDTAEIEDEMRATFANTKRNMMWPDSIPRSKTVLYSLNRRSTLAHYAPKAPETKTFRNLADHIVSHENR
jgi:cellulose biosynthesis protein BcsQ